jgi:GTP-binding protein
MSLGLVALVGEPSSGKSTLFNRIVGERKSIVEETPGITRDRLYARANWLTKDFTIVDTGGIQIKNVPFQTEIRAQVQIAIEQADLIVFVVDGKKGLTGDDRLVAKMLFQSGKKVLLAVNKIDNINEIGNEAEFYKLGFGDPFVVSGAHGIGIGDLLDAIIKSLPEKPITEYPDSISLSRSSVGRMSANRLWPIGF